MEVITAYLSNDDHQFKLLKRCILSVTKHSQIFVHTVLIVDHMLKPKIEQIDPKAKAVVISAATSMSELYCFALKHSLFTLATNHQVMFMNYNDILLACPPEASLTDCIKGNQIIPTEKSVKYYNESADDVMKHDYSDFEIVNDFSGYITTTNILKEFIQPCESFCVDLRIMDHTDEHGAVKTNLPFVFNGHYDTHVNTEFIKEAQTQFASLEIASNDASKQLTRMKEQLIAHEDETREIKENIIERLKTAEETHEGIVKINELLRKKLE